MERGTRRKAVRESRRFNAEEPSASLSTTKTITRSPKDLIQRFKATSGKSDQTTLRAQYRKNSAIAPLSRSSAATFGPRRIRTITPANRRAVRKFLSNGLPSRYASVVAAGACRFSQSDTMREPAISSQIVGIQSAGDVRAWRSRFSANRAQIQIAHRTVAILVIVIRG